MEAKTVYCARCGQRSDRGMVQVCRRCSGIEIPDPPPLRVCDDCGESTRDVAGVFLRSPGSATLYDTRNAFDLCLACRKKRRGAYRLVPP